MAAYGTLPTAAGAPSTEKQLLGTSVSRKAAILGFVAALATVAVIAGYSSSSASAVSLLGGQPIYVVDIPMNRGMRMPNQRRSFQG
jgi:hypothetical protein